MYAYFCILSGPDPINQVLTMMLGQHWPKELRLQAFTRMQV